MKTVHCEGCGEAHEVFELLDRVILTPEESETDMAEPGQPGWVVGWDEEISTLVGVPVYKVLADREDKAILTVADTAMVYSAYQDEDLEEVPNVQ